MPDRSRRWTTPDGGIKAGSGRRFGQALAVLAFLTFSAPGVALGDSSGAPSPAPRLSVAELGADILPQLVPPDPTFTVAISLASGSYQLPFDPPSAGRLAIAWYVGNYPSLPSSVAKLKRIAGGRTSFGGSYPSRIAITASNKGRDLIEDSRSLTVTAAASFTPARAAPVLLVKVFTLR